MRMDIDENFKAQSELLLAKCVFLLDLYRLYNTYVCADSCVCA